MEQSLVDLWHGFEVALQIKNLLWSFFGVLVGNLIGVLPGMGPLSAISILLPLTYSMQPVPAILMPAGIFYGFALRKGFASIAPDIFASTGSRIIRSDPARLPRTG